MVNGWIEVLLKPIITACITAAMTLLGIKYYSKREKSKEKYLVLKIREVRTLQGKDTYEISDNATIKQLIDDIQDLQTELAGSKALNEEQAKIIKNIKNENFGKWLFLAAWLFLLTWITAGRKRKKKPNSTNIIKQGDTEHDAIPPDDFPPPDAIHDKPQ